MAEGTSGVDLSKKMGPLPTGVWIIIIAGGLAVGYFINKRSSANAAAAPTQVAETGSGLGGSGFDVVSPPPPAAPTDTTPETNESWRMKVTNWLIAKNYDPAQADTAVRAYLYGQPLTAAQQAIINIALVQFGVPPEPIPGLPDTNPPINPTPVPTAPSPVSGLTGLAASPQSVQLTWLPSSGATSYHVSSNYGYQRTVYAPLFTLTGDALLGGRAYTWTVTAKNDAGTSEGRSVTVTQPGGNTTPAPAPTPTPTNRTYTVVAGDTLTGIAVKMYGSPSKWTVIYSANSAAIEDAARAHGHSSSRGPNGSNGWWIFPGTRLVIP